MKERRPLVKLLNNKETTEQSLDQRLRIRRFNAIILGRILPTETPAFIGTWDLGSPARGLFEIYLDNFIFTEKKSGDEEEVAEKIKFTGKIEDTLGTATVTGTITKEEIVFTKKYCPNKSSKEASRTAVSYIGRFNGIQYEGTYEIRDNNFVMVCRPFQLKMFTISVANNLAQPIEDRPPLFGKEL